MLKHFIKWQIKQWWPLLLIFASILSIIWCGTTSEISITYTSVSYGYYEYGAHTASLLAIFIPAFVAAMVMPFFVYSYRAKKQSADAFLQAPYKSGTIKRVRVIIGLALVLIAVSVAYWNGVIMYLLRYLAAPAKQTAVTGREVFYKDPVYFGYFFFGFLALILFVGAHYFINCFLVGLGDYRLDQVMLLIFGNILLTLVFTAPWIYGIGLATILGNGESIGEWIFLSTLYGFGPSGGFAFSINVVGNLIYGKTVDAPYVIVPYIAFLIELLFGAFCGVMEMIQKEPSGEHVDTRGPRNQIVALIPHGAGLVLGICVSYFGTATASSLTVLPIVAFMMYGAMYYVFLSIWRHSFKPAKFDLIMMFVVIGISFLLLINLSALVINKTFNIYY